MSLLHIPFDNLQASDLETLVANGVREGRYLEYKERVIGGMDSERKEFLADVVSFANADGGDLILGMREKRDEKNAPTGIPDQIVGLPGINFDREIHRLESMIRTGIGPRVSGIRMGSVGDPPSLVIRIPRSWTGPHMVTTSESRFYSRNSAGKFPLDVGQIREAMLGGETRLEKLRLFRADRVARVVAQETPVPVDPGPKLVLHAIPMRDSNLFDRIMNLTENERLNTLRPMRSRAGFTPSRNADGHLTRGTLRDGTGPYVQVFRSGILESVGRLVWNEHDISGTAVEDDAISALEEWLRLWKLVDEAGPMMMALSITGVRGFQVQMDRQDFGRSEHLPIDRDVVLIPEVVEDDLTKEADVILNRILDIVWQASGRQASPNYENGKRLRRL